jgi:hypothetical protein
MLVLDRGTVVAEWLAHRYPSLVAHRWPEKWALSPLREYYKQFEDRQRLV